MIKALILFCLLFSTYGFGEHASKTESSRRPTANVTARNPEQTLKIKKFIEDLGADKFSIRHRAMMKLVEMGPDVLPFVRDALKSDDAEVRKRSEIIINALSRKLNCFEIERALLKALRDHPVVKEANDILDLVQFANYRYISENEKELRKIEVQIQNNVHALPEDGTDVQKHQKAIDEFVKKLSARLHTMFLNGMKKHLKSKKFKIRISTHNHNQFYSAHMPKNLRIEVETKSHKYSIVAGPNFAQIEGITDLKTGKQTQISFRLGETLPKREKTKNGERLLLLPDGRSVDSKDIPPLLSGFSATANYFFPTRTLSFPEVSTKQDKNSQFGEQIGFGNQFVPGFVSVGQTSAHKYVAKHFGCKRPDPNQPANGIDPTELEKTGELIKITTPPIKDKELLRLQQDSNMAQLVQIAGGHYNFVSNSSPYGTGYGQQSARGQHDNGQMGQGKPARQKQGVRNNEAQEIENEAAEDGQQAENGDEEQENTENSSGELEQKQEPPSPPKQRRKK